MQAVLNHLWQSTAFAGAAAVLCWLLRNNPPRTRYWVWFAASVKFAVPFSLLVALGSRADLPAPDTPLATAMAVETVSTVFAPAPLGPGPESTRWPMVLGMVWAVGALAVSARWMREWLRLRGIVRRAAPAEFDFPVEVRVTTESIEPGVVGVARPVLLLPAGLEAALTEPQREAILVHEYCHIRNRDNLTSALHMGVSALFWFHPAVWWIGANLVRERERACDEAVLREGGDAAEYARGIVSVCKLYVASPLPCAAGVTGSDLARRVREIMAGPLSRRLTLTRKAAIACAAVGAVALPAVIGILRAQTLPPAPEYTYEVATIRPSPPGVTNSQIGPGPQGGIKTQNVTTMQLLTFAYNRREFHFTGAPDWVKSARYNVALTPDKPEVTAGPGMSRDALEGLFNRQRQRMQALLRDRFGLVLRAENREMPIYAMTLAKGGHKLSRAADTSNGPHLRMGRGSLDVTAAYMYMVAENLSGLLGRTVTNETGLDGPFDFRMTWTPDTNAPGPDGPAALGGDGPSVFTAITEQLGLKLESKRGPVQVYVIEKIEKPSDN